MKTYAYILVLFAVLCCKKPDELIIEVIEKPLIFENLTACKCDTTPNAEFRDICKSYLSDTFVLKNVNGKIDYTSIRSVRPDYPMIRDYMVDENRFPIWKDYTSTLIPCNIPDEILKLPTGVKVKFDCRLLYMPPYPKGMVIDYAGYPVELLRIEVLK
jgi:hypothetical protein